jgi:hypothetical protein
MIITHSFQPVAESGGQQWGTVKEQEQTVSEQCTTIPKYVLYADRSYDAGHSWLYWALRHYFQPIPGRWLMPAHKEK